jgi:hypothetical protein
MCIFLGGGGQSIKFGSKKTRQVHEKILLVIVRFVTIRFEAQNRLVIIRLVIVHLVTVFVL